MTLYYIEKKEFYTDAHGVDHQMADYTELPILYHSKEKALRRACHMADIFWNIHGKEFRSCETLSCAPHLNQILALRFKRLDGMVRYYLSVYKVETRV